MKHGHSTSKPNGQALGYARVSTDEQAREGVSLEAQVARIRAYAVAKELELVEVLTDDGISGKTLDRPALRELVRRCERGEVGHVVVVKLDRLTRRTRDLLALVDDLFLARQIELHSVSESLDTSTPHGRFVLTLVRRPGADGTRVDRRAYPQRPSLQAPARAANQSSTLWI